MPRNIKGFEDLPNELQKEIMNMPENLQPLPKPLNSSKGAKIESGTDGWKKYIKEGRDIHPEYRKWLKTRQQNVQKKASDIIRNYQKGEK